MVLRVTPLPWNNAALSTKRRRAPGARRDAAVAPARGARTGALARARAATFERADEGFKLLKVRIKLKFEIQNPMLT